MNAPVRIIDTPERIRLSVDDFLLLNDSGAFDGWAKTELIDGEIYGMNAQHSRHARIKSRLARQLGNVLERIGSDLEAISEVTIRAADNSAPEPDIVLTRFRGDREVPADTIAMVIEVADTTLDRDLGRKAALYAAAGIAEYWLLDINAQRTLLHSGPTAAGYTARTEVPFGGLLASVTIEGLEVTTARLID